MILTGATNTDIIICNADLKSTNKTDINCTKLIPLHASTPQVYWISNILLQEGTELFFSQRYYTIKANSLMFGVSRKVLLFKKYTFFVI